MTVITERTTTYVPKQEKIKNLFKRDPETDIIIGDSYTKNVFKYIDYWTITEKIDGMNIRVHANKIGDFLIGGKTDRVQIPDDLVENIESMLKPEDYDGVTFAKSAYILEVLDDFGYSGYDVTLFGEGYGPGIRNGEHYREDKSFILYDVCFTRDDGVEFFAPPAEVEQIADKLGIPCVKMYHEASFVGAIYLVEVLAGYPFMPDIMPKAIQEIASEYDWYTPEGIVCYPSEPLYDSFGERIVFKLKVKDVEKWLNEEGRLEKAQKYYESVEKNMNSIMEAMGIGINPANDELL